MKLQALAIVAVLSPVSALAEGAVQDLTCEIVSECDPTGACTAGGSVPIVIEPLRTEGTINVVSILIEQREVEALQDGAFGAMEWTTEDSREWLIPAGPSSLVWVKQTMGESLWSVTRMLSCVGAG
ncbi:hypothetical protein [Wenxinia marina]|uniref:Uncharacterized protein n=1 Tax=Wenxinia marina DSM 24838 TaxID=1123501 RepID=A0A0D0P7X9_9RHOB|nr:hypothetical protein [Wenxinia marina]KIQ67666.1 hypothetical protein Wenmar_03795 [Wenxinia marina DSM 24838]GGL79886.1 hypothetical protein GCM10011392_38000 [Wenxinia marina]